MNLTRDEPSNEQNPSAAQRIHDFENFGLGISGASDRVAQRRCLTPGHQSLRVRIGSDTVVMTGDACYLRRSLDNFHPPTSMYDREQMLESIRQLRALRDQGAMIITGHSGTR